MNEFAARDLNGPIENAGPCGRPFLLCELVEGQNDKLGHKVEEILWIGRGYVSCTRFC
jgi:hypothetical protein